MYFNESIVKRTILNTSPIQASKYSQNNKNKKEMCTETEILNKFI